MRFDASPPVCYVRLYRLCSLVSSPVFTHIFAFSSVLLCSPLFSSVFLCPLVLVRSRLSALPSVPISLSVPCHPAQRSISASNPVRTQSAHSLPLGGSFGRNRAIDYPSGRNRGRIRPFQPPNHGFRPNEPHSRATHPRIRSPTRLVLGQGKRLDCTNG